MSMNRRELVQYLAVFALTTAAEVAFSGCKTPKEYLPVKKLIKSETPVPTPTPEVTPTPEPKYVSPYIDKDSIASNPEKYISRKKDLRGVVEVGMTQSFLAVFDRLGFAIFPYAKRVEDRGEQDLIYTKVSMSERKIGKWKVPFNFSAKCIYTQDLELVRRVIDGEFNYNVLDSESRIALTGSGQLILPDQLVPFSQNIFKVPDKNDRRWEIDEKNKIKGPQARIMFARGNERFDFCMDGFGIGKLILTPMS